MFPLQVILAGCGERELVPVQRELQAHGIPIEGVYQRIAEVLLRREDFKAERRLFLTHLQTEQQLLDTKRLNQAFPGHPILALMDDGDNASCLLVAMRAGVSQIVPLPLEAPDFKEALDCIGLQYGNQAKEAKVLAVSGVAGGCGATTLAINLAHEIAHGCGQRTILAELSMQMGMMVTYLDFESKFTLDDLLSYTEQLDVRVIDQSLTRVSDKLALLPGPRRPVISSTTAQAKIATILGYLKQLADVVVLDVPCTFDDSYFNLLRGTDQVVLVGEQRIPSIRNVQLVLETLGRKESEGKQELVVNRYDRKLAGFAAPDLAKLLRLPRVLTVANDPTQVAAALNQGKTLREIAPNSPALADIKTLTRSLLNLNETAVPASGVFRRLFNAVGFGVKERA